MKLLVIGGSYFFGRVFVMQASKEHDITVVNRGTYSMAALGVKQITGDRRDEGIWQSCKEDYDVIIDFCAYEKGDIARVLRNMPGNVQQYIFISTVDVYERGIIHPGSIGGSSEAIEYIMNADSAASGAQRIKEGGKDETTPLETRLFSGEAGSYIAGKVALEREVQEECGRRGIPCTVLRPAILYGPYNYAPREALYIQMMVQNHVLPHITNAPGAFQFLYIKDAAEAVIRCLMNETAYGQAYNLCQDKVVTYEIFYEELRKAADVEVNEMPMTVEEAQNQGIPLPFPVTEEETELCSNEKGKKELGINYTDFAEGMAKTYRAFKGVYSTKLAQ